jgi:hypothetical protein
MRLLSKIMRTSAISAISSAINLFATVIIVRYFGATIYTDLIFDLALISLIAISLESVPSNYLLFKLQDAPEWLGSLKAVTVANVFILLLLIFVFSVLDAFKTYSPWMLIYGLGLVLKRYHDITLQAQGRLVRFMVLEASASIIKLFALSAFWYLDSESSRNVWFSLSVAVMLPSLYVTVVGALKANSPTWSVANAFEQIYKDRKSFFPYYAGIGLKRLKDNFVPIAGSYIITDPEMLAGFFLIHRGIAFSIGQLRIIEAFLYHRSYLFVFSLITSKKKIILGFAVHLLAFCSSYALVSVSNVEGVDVILLLTFSVLVWPIALNIMERMQALSVYDTYSVNISLLCYLVAVCSGVLVLFAVDRSLSLGFAVVIIVSEIISYFAFKMARNKGAI